MPDAEPDADALESAPAPDDAAPEPTPDEPAAAEAAIEEPVADAPANPVTDGPQEGEPKPDESADDDATRDEAAADDGAADDGAAGEAPAAEEAAPAEADTTEPPEIAADRDDSVEKVLSNTAMDSIFGSDDEPDAGDHAAENTATAEPDAIPTAWTADDADQDAADDARADGFPPPPGAAGESVPDEAVAAAEGGKRRSGLMRLISLLALILLITAVVSVGYFMQSKVVMWFPATSKIYAMVGLKPDVLGQGLHIADPKPTKEIDGNDEVLVVSGAIKNTSGNRQKVPLLRGALLDKNGKELHIWTFTAQQESVEPGEQATYQTQFKNPPAAAEKLDITFTRSGDAQTAGRDAAMPDKK